jgi:hypothetical protein
MNRLYFGDNLGWLRDKNVFPDACVDLVYLDPPFNSNANYNVLFKGAERRGQPRDERTKCEPQAEASGRERSQPTGEASQAQFHAFTDTWEWTRDDIATLLGDVNNQKAAGGVLITLEAPTKPMKKEAIDAGRYTATLYQKEFPKIQILTIACSTARHVSTRRRKRIRSRKPSGK